MDIVGDLDGPPGPGGFEAGVDDMHVVKGVADLDRLLLLEADDHPGARRREDRAASVGNLEVANGEIAVLPGRPGHDLEPGTQGGRGPRSCCT